MGKTFSKMFDKWFGLQEMRVRLLPRRSPCLPTLNEQPPQPQHASPTTRRPRVFFECGPRWGRRVGCHHLSKAGG